MQFGKVIGNVISTSKTKCGVGLPLLVIQLLDEKLRPHGKTIVCTDAMNARQGDIVLTCGSSSARMTEQTKSVCTDNTIVAIVEIVSKSKEDVYKKDT